MSHAELRTLAAEVSSSGNAGERVAVDIAPVADAASQTEASPGAAGSAELAPPVSESPLSEKSESDAPPKV